MLADRVRMDQYAFALKAAIKPGDVVVDIGTSVGIHALLAGKFGARKVYAIEPNEAIDIAYQLAQANGYGDRIEFIQDLSTQVSLPEPADVIVSDLRGALPLFDHHIPAIIDARYRFLKPGGILIPQQDHLYVAAIEASGIYKSILKPWSDPYGLNMAVARHRALNQWQQEDTDLIRPSAMVTEAVHWATLDYRTIESPHVAGTDLRLHVTRPGAVHGLLLWFDANLTDDFGFSNSPVSKKPAAVYGRGFFPLLEPVDVTAGDMVRVDLRAEFTEQGYHWHWQTRFSKKDDPGRYFVEFDQSTATTGPPA